MQPLSQADEKRLLAALEDTATYANDGLAPNDAIAKAATTHRVPAGHIDLMVYAYNTGRTTRQRQTGDSLLEKSADFPIADAAVVREMMFPTAEKKAAAIEPALSDEYLRPGKIFAARRERLKAAAHVDIRAGIGAPRKLAEEPGYAVNKAYDKVASLDRQHAEERRQLSAKQAEFAASLESVMDYFRKVGSYAVADVRPNAMRLYGPASAVILDQVTTFIPWLTKQAASPFRHSCLGEPYTLIEAAIAAGQDYQRERTRFTQKSAEHKQAREVLLAPFFPKPVSQKIALFDGVFSGVAGGVGGSIMHSTINGIAGGVAPEPTKDLVQKKLDEVTDPKHEATLRNIRTETVLQDLMQNDPVLSGYDPDTVLSAFNEIGELAPRTADQRPVLQMMLRKRLQQGALDPFEIDQLLSVENKLRQRSQPANSLTLNAG